MGFGALYASFGSSLMYHDDEDDDFFDSSSHRVESSKKLSGRWNIGNDLKSESEILRSSLNNDYSVTVEDSHIIITHFSGFIYKICKAGWVNISSEGELLSYG